MNSFARNAALEMKHWQQLGAEKTAAEILGGYVAWLKMRQRKFWQSHKSLETGLLPTFSPFCCKQGCLNVDNHKYTYIYINQDHSETAPELS